jgi:basic membrane protein A
MTESNIIGYIAILPDPRSDPRHQLRLSHASEVNPDVEFRVVWAYTWFDPAAEADAAQALIDAGADVILQHTDSTAPQSVAQEAGGVYTFGQASDMIQFAPAPRISSIIDTWAPYYIAASDPGHGRHLGTGPTPGKAWPRAWS